MATKRPSFLKRQKELKRNERALEKREARRGRREARAAERDNSTAPGLLGEGTEQNHDADDPNRVHP
jgi:hypothetical protein